MVRISPDVERLLFPGKPAGAKSPCVPPPLIVSAEEQAQQDADDAATRANALAIAAMLAAAGQFGPGDFDDSPICYCCGGRRFWVSAHGPIGCARCHPPATNDGIVRWIELPQPTTE